MITIQDQIMNINDAKEVPWRPGYQNFPISGKSQGVTVSATYAIVQPGAGAPLHFHETADEVLIILEGRLDLRLGEDRAIAGPNSCISIPAGTPHAFTAVGPEPAKFLAYLPKQGAYVAAKYLEGTPPPSGDLK